MDAVFDGGDVFATMIPSVSGEVAALPSPLANLLEIVLVPPAPRNNEQRQISDSMLPTEFDQRPNVIKRRGHHIVNRKKRFTCRPMTFGGPHANRFRPASFRSDNRSGLRFMKEIWVNLRIRSRAVLGVDHRGPVRLRRTKIAATGVWCVG